MRVVPTNGWAAACRHRRLTAVEIGEFLESTGGSPAPQWKIPADQGPDKASSPATVLSVLPLASRHFLLIARPWWSVCTPISRCFPGPCCRPPSTTPFSATGPIPSKMVREEETVVAQCGTQHEQCCSHKKSQQE